MVLAKLTYFKLLILLISLYKMYNLKYFLKLLPLKQILPISTSSTVSTITPITPVKSIAPIQDCLHISELKKTLSSGVLKKEPVYVNFGTEWIFSKIFKKISKNNQMYLITEEKSFNNTNGSCYGRCDLWMHDTVFHYNLSVELKCGSIDDETKITKLKEQTILYTNIYKNYFPEYDTIGLGIYLHKDGLYILKYHKESFNKITSINKINLLIEKLKNELDFRDSNIEICYITDNLPINNDNSGNSNNSNSKKQKKEERRKKKLTSK